MTNLGLTAAELAQMRNDLAGLLPDTCNILELTSTSDGAGGWTEAWGTASGGSAIPCRVDYRTGKEANSAGALTPFQAAVITFGYAVVCTPANRVQVGSNVFSVQAGNAGMSWKPCTQVEAQLVP